MKRAVYVWILASVVGGTPLLFAEPPSEATQPRDRQETVPATIGQRENRHDRRETSNSGEVERLRRLKEENPEAFRRAIQERKAQLRDRLTHLKETNPEAFERAKARIQEHRRQWLASLQQRNPQRFQQLMQEHRARLEERLQRLKEENPQRYTEVMRRQAEWRQRKLEEFKRNRPEAWEQFKANHPDWMQHEARAEPHRGQVNDSPGGDGPAVESSHGSR